MGATAGDPEAPHLASAVGRAAEEPPGAPAAAPTSMAQIAASLPEGEGAGEPPKEGGAAAPPACSGELPKEGGAAPPAEPACSGEPPQDAVVPSSVKPASRGEGLVVHERIGSGGYSNVFRASWKGQTIAVKVQSKAAARKAKKDVVQTRELNFLRQFATSQCPNIVRLLGWREYAFDLRLHLEYIPLTINVFTTDTIIPIRQIWIWAEGCSNGVLFLHTHKILYRDLKPGNILVKQRGISNL